jgi:integrase
MRCFYHLLFLSTPLLRGGCFLLPSSCNRRRRSRTPLGSGGCSFSAGRRRSRIFHFHMLRHTFTGNLLSNEAAPKDVQELPGHSDVSTTMNIYAHFTREAKRNSARLLDKVANGE